MTQPPRLTERARVPEKEPGFVGVEIGDGHLVITHDGSLPPFASGDVLAGTEGGGFLVRVLSVRSPDPIHVTLETTPAALTELLSEGELHIHYDARDYMRRLDEYMAAQRTPDEEDGEPIASDAEALMLKTGSSIPLLHLAGASLPTSCKVGASGTATLDVEASLTPVIDLDLHIAPKGGLNPFPEIKHFRFVASGDLDIETSLHAEGTITGACSVDLLALAGGAASIPLPPLTFWVGPVPVIITTQVVPIARADLSLSFQAAQVDAESHTAVGLSAGVDYANKHWTTVWDPSCDATGSAILQSPGDITASCKVSAGAELRARLYGIVGPDVGLEAYARATADSAPPYCTYDGQIDGGVAAYADATLGVSLGPLDLTIARLDLVHLELVHFDGPEFSGDLREDGECDDSATSY